GVCRSDLLTFLCDFSGFSLRSTLFAYTRPPSVSAPTQTVSPSLRRELARDLGVSHASAVVVGTIIGSGIFLVPAEMMQAVGWAKLVYLAWVVGVLLSFFGALTYGDVGALTTHAGGVD